MKINIRNYRRLERADISGGPLVLIAGRNNAGKSSLLTATALAAVGWAIPQGVAKKDAADIILDGQQKASVALFLADGSAVKVELPKCDVVFDGTMRVSTIAAGLHSVCGAKPEVVSKELGNFIGAAPTLNDILDDVKDRKIPIELAGSIWKVIEASGWDKALDLAREKGVKLKGRWETATGQKKWGSKVGASWAPEGWHADLPAVEEAAVIDMRRALQSAREGAAVSDAEINRLKQESESFEADKQAAADATAALAQAESTLEAAIADRSKIPTPNDGSGDMPCPHCGAMVHLDQSRPGIIEIKQADVSSRLGEAALKTARIKIAAGDGAIANARSAVGAAKSADINARVALGRSEAAARSLSEAQAKGGIVSNVDALTAELAELEGRFMLHHRMKEAKGLHELIEVNAQLQEMLAPDGLRHKILVRSIGRFNEESLLPLTTQAGFRRITLSPDMVLSSGDTQWRDLGESERWIVERIMQLAIAKLDGSSLVIIDRADVCDAGNRNKLFGLLMAQSGFEIIVGITMNKRELVPNLGAAGVTYWIEDGKAEQLHGNS